MKYIAILAILTTYISCDSPVRSRNPYAAPVNTTGVDVQGSDNQNNSGNTNNNANQDNTTKTNPDTGTTTNETTNSPGFENCDLGYDRYLNAVGNFALCHSTVDEARFKAKFANTDSSLGTCFIPIHVNSDGSSYNLGPAECVHHQGGKVYSFGLSKDRSENINGVMIVKANALNGYMQCMSAKMYYMSNFQNCSYNVQCVQAASQYASEVCGTFTQVYVGNYLQVNF